MRLVTRIRRLLRRAADFEPPIELDGLPLPMELIEMMRDGRWPRTGEESRKQGWSRVPKEQVQAIAPWEHMIYFYPPPFSTVATRARLERRDGRFDYWTGTFTALHEIDPTKAIDLGDFGLGSDAPFILDYRENPQSPRVLALKIDMISKSAQVFDNHWVQIAPSFADFVNRLGLHGHT